MSEQRRNLGMFGEELAVKHIMQAGLTILDRNYRCPMGEMDIIAREGETVIFIEVRTRTTGKRGWGEESITPQKRARLNRIGTHFLKYHNYKGWPPLRFDLIAIRIPDQPDNPAEMLWIRGI
ncbi:YraN family protein [Desulfitobacterium sp. THU1]|uniref:YraN family protein n=1 Tax=Desulfitobacterium sp. THU1 TaxID=3138072 RepID=UPI0031204B2D